MARYWIGVASRQHVMKGVDGGFAMLNHGKEAPLKRMSEGDYIVYYSPKDELSDKEPLQKFTAIGKVLAGEPYQVRMSDTFEPFRKNVSYLKCISADIRPLIDDLGFIRDKKSWGYAFRFGHIEIGKSDYDKIAGAMDIAE